MRVLAAAVLIAGGLLGVLPMLSFWMLPLGAVLLAEDVPMLKRPTMRVLGAIQKQWDGRHWARGRP